MKEWIFGKLSLPHLIKHVAVWSATMEEHLNVWHVILSLRTSSVLMSTNLVLVVVRFDRYLQGAFSEQ
jgi:hypothetical protein